MPGISIDELEHYWRVSLYSDFKKAYDILSQYVSDAGLNIPFGLAYYKSLDESYATAFELKSAIEHFSGAYDSVEFLIASIKQNMALQHIHKIELELDRRRFDSLKDDTLYIKTCDGVLSCNFKLSSGVSKYVYILYSELGLPNNSGIAELTPLLPDILKKLNLELHKLKKEDILFDIFSFIKTKIGIDYFTMDQDEVINRYLRLGPSISLGEWTKHALTKPKTDSKVLQRQEQCYMKSIGSNHGIHMLHLSLFMNGNTKLRVQTPNKTSFDRLMVALVESSFPLINDKTYPLDYTISFSSFNLRTELPDEPNLSKFLSMLVELDGSIVTLIDDICHLLQLEKVLMIEPIRVHTDRAIAYVIQEQNLQKNFESIWILATDYQDGKKTSFEALLSLFKAISADSPYYSLAQEQVASLLLSAVGTEKTYIEILEEAFPYVLNSKNQGLIDSVFDQLCGYQRISIGIQNIQGELNTLLKLAEKIRELNKQLQVTHQPTSDDNVDIISGARIRGTFYYYGDPDNTASLEYSFDESASIN